MNRPPMDGTLSAANFLAHASQLPHSALFRVTNPDGSCAASVFCIGPQDKSGEVIIDGTHLAWDINPSGNGTDAVNIHGGLSPQGWNYGAPLGGHTSQSSNNHVWNSTGVTDLPYGLGGVPNRTRFEVPPPFGTPYSRFEFHQPGGPASQSVSGGINTAGTSGNWFRSPAQNHIPGMYGSGAGGASTPDPLSGASDPHQMDEPVDKFAGRDLSPSQQEGWAAAVGDMSDDMTRATAFYAAKIVQSRTADRMQSVFTAANRSFAALVTEAALRMASKDVQGSTGGPSLKTELEQRQGLNWGEDLDAIFESWKSERADRHRHRSGFLSSLRHHTDERSEFERYLAENAEDIPVTLEAYRLIKREFGDHVTPHQALQGAVERCKQYSSWCSKKQASFGSFPFSSSGSGFSSIPSFRDWSIAAEEASRRAQTASNTAANGSRVHFA